MNKTINPISNLNNAISTVKKRYQMYLMLLPALAVILVFKYVPMYGIIIAFQDFNIFAGINGSQWVGLDNFYKLFNSEEFYRVFRNTLLISIYKITFLFPFPIFVALLMNEVKNMPFKRTVQTVIYLPHFLSWVIIAGLFTTILSSTGIVNGIISFCGGEKIQFMMDPRYFRSVLVVSEGWKEVGWNTIIYMAAMAGVDQELYEAAEIDGAGRIRKMFHITLPLIAPTIVMLFILKLGRLLDVGLEQVLVMYNSLVYETGDVIGTYVYRMGLGKGDYSFSTAVGLFNSAAGFFLIVAGNYLSRKFVQRSIW